MRVLQVELYSEKRDTMNSLAAKRRFYGQLIIRAIALVGRIL